MYEEEAKEAGAELAEAEEVVVEVA